MNMQGMVGQEYNKKSKRKGCGGIEDSLCQNRFYTAVAIHKWKTKRHAEKIDHKKNRETAKKNTNGRKSFAAEEQTE